MNSKTIKSKPSPPKPIPNAPSSLSVSKSQNSHTLSWTNVPSTYLDENGNEQTKDWTYSYKIYRYFHGYYSGNVVPGSESTQYNVEEDVFGADLEKVHSNIDAVWRETDMFFEAGTTQLNLGHFANSSANINIFQTDATSYTFSNLHDDSIYIYKVTALNEDGEESVFVRDNTGEIKILLWNGNSSPITPSHMPKSLTDLGGFALLPSEVNQRTPPFIPVVNLRPQKAGCTITSSRNYTNIYIYMYRQNPKGSIDNISRYSLSKKVTNGTGRPAAPWVAQSTSSTAFSAFSSSTYKSITFSNLPPNTTFDFKGKIQTDMRRGGTSTAVWEDSNEVTHTNTTYSYYTRRSAAEQEITVKKSLMWGTQYGSYGNSQYFTLPVWETCSASDLINANAQIANFANEFANIPKVGTYTLDGNVYQKWVPKWRIKSANASDPTILNINTNHANHSLFANGDIIAAFDGSTYECLDIKVWNDGNNTTTLILSKYPTGGYGIRPSYKPYFQLYRPSLNRIFDIQVSYAVRSDTNNSSHIYQISGGALEATYENVRFKFCKTQVKVYRNGVHSNTYTIWYDNDINGQITSHFSNAGPNFDLFAAPFSLQNTADNIIITHKTITNGTAYSATTFYESDPWVDPPPTPP